MYTYDAADNRKTKTGAGMGSASSVLTNGVADDELLTYNGFNQLVCIEAGTDTITYSYYPSRLRATKGANSAVTKFILDGGNVAMEAVNGAATAKYIRSINLLYSITGGATDWYIYNAHGDVVQLTDASGAVTKEYAYDAFGVEKDPDANDMNPFRYCGEYFDLSSGLYYLRARYYNPATGRFLTEDTYWNPGNMVYGDARCNHACVHLLQLQSA